nr:divergent polysaccharide deacetylase family protein [Saccharophagus degradans]
MLACIFALFQSCNGGNQETKNNTQLTQTSENPPPEKTERPRTEQTPPLITAKPAEPVEPSESIGHTHPNTAKSEPAAAKAVEDEPAIEVIAKPAIPVSITEQPTVTSPRIAIIIDDIGYRFDEGRELIELPYPLTFAFIPFSPYGTRLAELAKQLNKPVMLHAPMATLNESKWEASLNPTMARTELIASLDAMLADIPHVTGVNNHGGSLFTQSRESMQWLSEALAERELFFVDSRTTAQSVAKEEAQRVNIPFNERDVFLDNERDLPAIDSQLDKLVAIALKHGEAVAIGHPYPETLQALKARLPLLAAQGVEVVGIELLLNRHRPVLSQSQTDKILPEG